jgi:hypothetical protein
MIFDTKAALDRHIIATGNRIPADPLRAGGAFLRELASTLADAAAYAPPPPPVPPPAVSPPTILSPTPVLRQHRETPRFIADYFAQFPTFRYNARREVWEQFYALRGQMGMNWDDARFESERDTFRDALVQEFNGFYGTDENDLRAWRALCREVGVEPLPTTIKSCRQVCLISCCRIFSSHGFWQYR